MPSLSSATSEPRSTATPRHPRQPADLKVFVGQSTVAERPQMVWSPSGDAQVHQRMALDKADHQDHQV